jgi:putative membrane protein
MMMYGGMMYLAVIAHAVLYLVLLTLAVLGIIWLIRALRTQTTHSNPIDVLQRRYAAGEISDEEYQQRLNALRGT